VPHQSVQSADVPVAFAKKAVCEPVPKLVRGEATDARPFTDAPNHSHQRLRAGWLLRILRPAQPFELRNELLDLDCEHVIIGLGLESHPHSAEPRPQHPGQGGASASADPSDKRGRAPAPDQDQVDAEREDAGIDDAGHAPSSSGRRPADVLGAGRLRSLQLTEHWATDTVTRARVRVELAAARKPEWREGT
jgi:hypothetical protein